MPISLVDLPFETLTLIASYAAANDLFETMRLDFERAKEGTQTSRSRPEEPACARDRLALNRTCWILYRASTPSLYRDLDFQCIPRQNHERTVELLETNGKGKYTKDLSLSISLLPPVTSLPALAAHEELNTEHGAMQIALACRLLKQLPNLRVLTLYTVTLNGWTPRTLPAEFKAALEEHSKDMVCLNWVGRQHGVGLEESEDAQMAIAADSTVEEYLRRLDQDEGTSNEYLAAETVRLFPNAHTISLEDPDGEHHQGESPLATSIASLKGLRMLAALGLFTNGDAWSRAQLNPDFSELIVELTDSFRLLHLDGFLRLNGAKMHRLRIIGSESPALDDELDTTPYDLPSMTDLVIESAEPYTSGARFLRRFSQAPIICLTLASLAPFSMRELGRTFVKGAFKSLETIILPDEQPIDGDSALAELRLKLARRGIEIRQEPPDTMGLLRNPFQERGSEDGGDASIYTEAPLDDDE